MRQIRLTVSMSETSAGEFDGTMEYATDSFRAADHRPAVEHFHRIWTEIADTQQCVWDIPILGESERQILLADFSGAQFGASAAACVHHVFEEQAGKIPDRVALCFRGSI